MKEEFREYGKDGRSSSGGSAMTGQTQISQTRTLAIPMMYGRELLLQTPEVPIKSDMAYLDLLENYIGLLKRQAEQAPEVMTADYANGSHYPTGKSSVNPA